jgi:hypothetical protein
VIERRKKKKKLSFFLTPEKHNFEALKFSSFTQRTSFTPPFTLG